MAVVCDTGAVYALYDADDVHHADCRALVEVERGPLFPKDTFTAQSKFTATGRTWDYRDVPFRPGRGPMNPHLDELFMIAKSVTNLGGILDNVAGIASKLVVP